MQPRFFLAHPLRRLCRIGVMAPSRSHGLPVLVSSTAERLIVCAFLLAASACTAASARTAAVGDGASADANLETPAAPFKAPYLPSSESEVLQNVPSIADPA